MTNEIELEGLKRQCVNLANAIMPKTGQVLVNAYLAQGKWIDYELGIPRTPKRIAESLIQLRTELKEMVYSKYSLLSMRRRND